MSKKSAPKARTTRRTRKTKPTPAPLGLRVVFDGLQSGAYCDTNGPTDVEIYATAAQGILKALGKDGDLLPVVFDVTKRDYSGSDIPAHESPELVGISAFWCGVATCWHVMTAINGGAR